MLHRNPFLQRVLQWRHSFSMMMQQMLQIQTPAEVLRLLQSSAAVVADAKTIKDVQGNVRLVAQELEARTKRLASCLSGITGDLDGVKHQTQRLLNAASDHHVALHNANGKIKELGEQQIVPWRIDYTVASPGYLSGRAER